MKIIRIRKILIAVILFLMIVLFSLPTFRSGVYEGHDIIFHLGRLQEITAELKSGQFPVRYEHNAWFGYGYISSTMYPNIFLYIPAILIMVGVSLVKAYNIYILMVNILTVLIAYFSFKALFKGDKWGLLATIIYTFSAYRFSNVYRRAAVGEYTAMAFIPLLVYGLYKLYFSEKEEDILKKLAPIVISTFGIIQSHMLTTEMLAMFVFIFAVVFIRRTFAHIKEIILSIVCILITNAFYLVPFIEEYLTEKLVINTSITNFGVDGEGLFISQFFKPFSEGRGWDLSWSPEHEEFLALGVGLVICAALFVFVCFKVRKWTDLDLKNSNFKVVLVTFIFGLLSAYMSSVYFPWGALEKANNFFARIICSIQFPWRYLLIQTICFSIVGVYSIKIIYNHIIEKKKSFYIIMLVMFGMIAIMQTGVFFRYLSMACPTITDEHIAGWPGEADSLYLLDGTNRKVVCDNLEVNETNGQVSIPIFGYRYVIVRDNEGERISYSLGDNNRIVIDEAKYAKDISVDFEAPMAWRVSEIVSLITILLLVLYWIRIFHFNKRV